MINHISIGVNNPEKVAGVLAELWDGYAFPFPPSPNSYFVLAGDGTGSFYAENDGSLRRNYEAGASCSSNANVVSAKNRSGSGFKFNRLVSLDS
ncbi:MAG TPA: hypothetical protein VGD05_06735 [Pyrinomonadaceae bacterium]